MKFYIIFFIMTIFMVSNLQLYQAETLDPKNDYTFKDNNNKQGQVVTQKLEHDDKGNKTLLSKGNNLNDNKFATTNTAANKEIGQTNLDNTKQLNKDANVNATNGKVEVEMSGKEYSLWEKFKKLFG